jgi:hypothetical protein
VLGLLAWYVFFPGGRAQDIPGLAKVRPSFFKILLCLAGLLIMLNSMLSSFVGITVEHHRLTLDYCWPRSDVVVEVGGDTVIRSEPVMNGRRARIVISDKGKIYFGSSTFRKVSDEMAKSIRTELAK